MVWEVPKSRAIVRAAVGTVGDRGIVKSMQQRPAVAAVGVR
jgi:hypothetical protein